WAATLAKDVDQSVQDARFAFNGGNLKVLRPSKQGRTVDQAGLVSAVHDALLNGATTVDLPVATVEPTVSSDDPQSLGITELIERGSTSFAGSIPEKKHNIQLAADRLNGVVVAPGQTFSFNDSVGPTTIDAGFQWGFAIESGNNGPKTVPSVAGGICQVATTLFQPVFWAGYQLEQRYWHLYWIPAYTSRGVVGLDVTVDGDSGLDFKWTNTTKDYILIQSASDDSNVYFALYGKKPPWKVSVDDAVITNRTPPDTRPIAQPEPTLPWGRSLVVETARDGFDAEVKRHVIPDDGSKARDLDLKSTYEPAHTVTLVGTGGKPASADVDAALQRAADALKPAQPKPAATAAPAATSASAPTTAVAPTSAAAPATPVAKPTAPPATSAPATSAPTAAAAKPQATEKPQATQKPQSNGIAPTPTPGH
ncbi:MAG: VanW family protein, partial [Chloroflexi bacterium]|nr:VanW family protein [Chloroflexota bacterium]